MVGRYRLNLLRVSCLSLGLALAGCGDAPQTQTPPEPTVSLEEAELARLAKALQKTVLEGVATGAAVGGGLTLTFGDDDDVGTGITIGAGAGAAAGSYVAWVQKKYTFRERRLRQVKEDLDRNALEMQQTIAVMNQVLATQKAELSAIQARTASGAASDADLAEEVAQANSNLAQMQLAIDGATKRQAEFTEARSVTKRRRDTTAPIDGDLAALTAQIAQMKAIANDLSTSL